MDKNSEEEEYYKQAIVDTIMNIDNLELLVYLHTFIELKAKAEV